MFVVRGLKNLLPPKQKGCKRKFRGTKDQLLLLLTIHNAMHPQEDVDRLYMKRSEGGRGLISGKDCIEL